MRWWGTFVAGAGLVLVQMAAFAQAPGSVERGKYLAEGVLACGNCHMQRGPQGQPLADKGLSGGMPFIAPVMKAYASNITPDAETGIGKWTDAQLGRAIREGIRPDGTLVGPPMPVEFYRSMSDEDLAHVIAWLRAQPAVSNKVTKSEYMMPLPASYGPPVGRVASVPPTDKIAYGKYLAEVGHCMECHTPRGERGDLQLATGMGAGGQVFPGPWGASVSRNITSHESGLKNWTDAQIATAIREGKDRQGNVLKPPMAFGFYKTMSEADMSSLVAYLRTLPPKPTGGAGK